MTDRITFSIGADGTMTVTAHRTATPGLVIHDQGPFGNALRITHHASGGHLGEFDEGDFQQAQDAAAALKGVADWTGGAEALQDERVIWAAIDAIEAAGGRFLPREGGLGERVAAKRRAHLAAKSKEGAAS
jgi:hypothetical protein